MGGAQLLKVAAGSGVLSLGVIHDDKDRATRLTVKVRISEGIPPRSRINDRTQRCGVGGQGDTTRGSPHPLCEASRCPRRKDRTTPQEGLCIG
ncbi:hypothetical protein FACS1894124_6190 [Spirochaetia bacterium]|jgi:hypothetical protein|nr:hypothetical protein FACS1894124_6190 [Spirochaetia bacterium]